MSRVDSIIKENRMLKLELERLVTLAKENENKHRGFQLVENAFLLSASVADLDKALSYLDEVFELRSALFLGDFAANFEKLSCERIYYVSDQILRYAYVDKRPYFGNYMQGLISEFQVARPIGSYLTAPIIEKGEIIASLNLYSPDPTRFSADDHDGFIRELSLKIGISLKNLHNLMTIKIFKNANHKFPSGGGVAGEA